MDLNEAQRTAVRTLRGPLLVLAGAGTGKTRVVTFRIAELIRTGTMPDRILAVTFTNKAAAEMQQRISALLGTKKRQARPQVGTFHSHCVQILRRHIRRLGYPEQFAIYDRGDQESIARSVLRDIRIPTAALSPSELVSQIGYWKSRAISSRQAVSVADTDKQHLAATAFRRYERALKQVGAVDFDDLLLCTLELFSRFEEVRHQEADRFDHLLIDEYQDTNGAQYRIVKTLAQRHRNLCVVGDDDQSIYGFRGAEVQHILRFQRDWPDAVVVRLEENYRCTYEILKAANQLIVFNKHRHEKLLRASRPGGEKPRIEQYPDEEAEAKAVVSDISRRLSQPGFAPRDFAILFRTNEQPRPFEAELRRLRIPYVLIGGMSFFDRREVRDTLAYLKVLEMPQDEVALLRIINTPPRGIGGKTVELLMSRAVAAGKSLWHILSDPKHLTDIPPAARNAIGTFVGTVQRQHHEFKQGNCKSLHELAKRWVQQVNYREEIDRLYPEESDREMRWANVEQVVNALAAYEANADSPNLGDFLRDLAINNRDMEGDKEKELQRNAVVLMTLHSAKGLEFPHVYMVGMEEGILPHHRSVGEDDSAVDEERRLCYVGITRAQDRLTFTLSLTRRKWGKPRESTPSRFLFEIIGQADNGPKKKKRARS